MTKNELVAAEVEKWDRTPFHPQAAVRGVGCDCKGLVWGIARDLGFPEADSFYAKFIRYDLGKRKNFPSQLLLEGFAALFDRVENVIPGDVLLLRVQTLGPAHIAIAARREGYAWHAQIEPNPFVKQASLRSLLKKCPLDSVWRWRDG